MFRVEMCRYDAITEITVSLQICYFARRWKRRRANITVYKNASNLLLLLWFIERADWVQISIKRSRPIVAGALSQNRQAQN